MARSPIDVYQSVQKETMSGRELEAHVLQKAVTILKDCQDKWGEPGHFDRLDDALARPLQYR